VLQRLAGDAAVDQRGQGGGGGGRVEEQPGFVLREDAPGPPEGGDDG
jgi:hypothetical protein